MQKFSQQQLSNLETPQNITDVSAKYRTNIIGKILINEKKNEVILKKLNSLNTRLEILESALVIQENVLTIIYPTIFSDQTRRELGGTGKTTYINEEGIYIGDEESSESIELNTPDKILINGQPISFEIQENDNSNEIIIRDSLGNEKVIINEDGILSKNVPIIIEEASEDEIIQLSSTGIIIDLSQNIILKGGKTIFQDTNSDVAVEITEDGIEIKDSTNTKVLINKNGILTKNIPIKIEDSSEEVILLSPSSGISILEKSIEISDSSSIVISLGPSGLYAKENEIAIVDDSGSIFLSLWKMLPLWNWVIDLVDKVSLIHEIEYWVTQHSTVLLDYLPHSCLDIYNNFPFSVSSDGYYMIYVDGKVHKVYCDMTSEGGGWTLVHEEDSNCVGTYFDNIDDLSLEYTELYMVAESGHWFDIQTTSAQLMWYSDGINILLNGFTFSDHYYFHSDAASAISASGTSTLIFLDPSKFNLMDTDIPTICKINGVDRSGYCGMRLIVQVPSSKRLQQFVEAQSAEAYGTYNNEYNHKYKLYLR